MTYRYRCCMCGSSSTTSAKSARDHLYKRHRDRLIRGLGLIETFGTRNDPNAPIRGYRECPDANTGASGEGDS